MTLLLKQLHLWFGDVCRHIEGEEEAKRLYSKLSNTSHPRIKGDALRSRCAQQATNSVWGKPDPALSRFQNDALVAARVLAGVPSRPRSGRLSVTGRCRVSCRWSGGALRRWGRVASLMRRP